MDKYMKLWYENDGVEWTSALPLGNGFLGAMCYGGLKGKFDITENTCWSGENQEQTLRPGALESMKQGIDLLMKQEYIKANEVLENCTGLKQNYGTQVPMGRMYLSLEEIESSRIRQLDLIEGVALDVIKTKDQEIKRESFISHPKRVMVSTLVVNQGTLPDVTLWLEGASQPAFTSFYPRECALTVKGRALEIYHSDGLSGVEYFMKLIYDTDGMVEQYRQGLVIKGATYVKVYLTAVTDMFEKELPAIANEFLQAGSKAGVNSLKEEHISDHKTLMDKCSFALEPSKDYLPTNERIAQFNKEDLGLIPLFFQYGRYLLLDSSRGNSQLPPALQGVWNDDRACRMAWTDDMHLDINTQMNYYPAERTGLGETMMPLFTWLKNQVVPNGKKIAKELYGSEGWVAHTVSNAYGWAAPGWDVGWAFGVMCGGWIITHIWEHYLYTHDKEFLEEYYQIIYGSAVFYHDLLKEKDGYLVTVPSYSPENLFNWEGKECTLTYGSTCDTTVTKTIFDMLIKASAILGKTDAFIENLPAKLAKLPPYKIGKHGQLMEWYEELEEARPDHRHTSHLLSMHPFNKVDPIEEPELHEAIQVTLKRRMGEDAKDIVYANWAGALLVIYFARMQDTQNASDFSDKMITYLSRDNMMITHQGELTSNWGGIYELDGNTGYTYGICEMLIQSFQDKIRICPALPSHWEDGNIEGLVTYSNHKVSLNWNEQYVTCSILAGYTEQVTLSYGLNSEMISLQSGETYTFKYHRI